MKLARIYQHDCTVGVLVREDFRCFTLELPYKDNEPNISAVPAGRYRCRKHISPKFGECLAIDNVLGRSHILIHPGNYTSQIQGCILVGDSLKDIDRDGIPDVTNSVATMDKLLQSVPDTFILTIV